MMTSVPHNVFAVFGHMVLEAERRAEPRQAIRPMDRKRALLTTTALNPPAGADQ